MAGNGTGKIMQEGRDERLFTNGYGKHGWPSNYMDLVEWFPLLAVELYIYI